MVKFIMEDPVKENRDRHLFSCECDRGKVARLIIWSLLAGNL
jgi:hypothetical protein